MFVFVEIVAWFTFLNWQLWNNTKEQIQWYSRKRMSLSCSPPSWVFGIVWPILYGLLTAFAVLTFGVEDIEVAIFVVFFVNILLNKLWPIVFFQRRQIALGAVVIVFMLATEIAILVLVGLAEKWVSFGLFVPYVLWCMYALVLNLQFACTK